MAVALAYQLPLFPEKVCRRCGETKPWEAFRADPRARDGRERYCRPCRTAQWMDWKRRNEDKQRAYMHAYYEAHKEQLLERFRAYREEHHAELRASRQAYWAANRDRLNADQRRRRVLNWAACAARSRAWRQAHKAKVKITDLHKVRLRRAARAGAEGTFTLEDVEQMYASQGGCCAYCGVPVGDVYDIDHIVPLSRGGSNWPGNLCIACPTCNSRKGRKPAEQFRAELAATHRVKLS